MRFIFPFPTAKQVAPVGENTEGWLCGYLVSDSSRCFIRYTVFPDYDAAFELDSLRILEEASKNEDLNGVDTLILCSYHDALVNPFIMPKFDNITDATNLKNGSIARQSEKLFLQLDYSLCLKNKSFDGLEKESFFETLARFSPRVFLLPPDFYVISLLKSVLLKKVPDNPNERGKIFLQPKLSKMIHESLYPDHCNRFDHFDVGIPDYI